MILTVIQHNKSLSGCNRQNQITKTWNTDQYEKRNTLMTRQQAYKHHRGLQSLNTDDTENNDNEHTHTYSTWLHVLWLFALSKCPGHDVGSRSEGICCVIPYLVKSGGRSKERWSPCEVNMFSWMTLMPRFIISVKFKTQWLHETVVY